jgi:hypothetical protein
VDLDEILYGGDGIEYYLLLTYVGKVGILVLPRTSCFYFVFKIVILYLLLFELLCFKQCFEYI